MDGFEIKPTKSKRVKKDAAIPDYKPKLMARRKKPEPPPPPKPVMIRLGVQHSINGMKYGPGVVEVPAHLASTLLAGDKVNAAEERKLKETRAIIFGPGRPTREVDPSYFDSPDSLMG